MSGLIIAPWQADERPPQPKDFLFGGTAVAAPGDEPGEPDWLRAKELGLGAVSFSLSPERLAAGGSARREALDAHARLAEAAAHLGLRVFVTLRQDGQPQDALAWSLADAPERFADVAEQAGLRLGHVASFVTLHEPGVLALPRPGGAMGREDLLSASARHAARAHALAMQALRATCAAPVGLALDLVTAIPLGREAADAPAARFVEACRTLAWLHLASARRGVITRALHDHGALSPQRAGMLGGIDAAEAPACDFVIARPLRPMRVAWRRFEPFELQADEAGAPDLEAWIPLVAAWAQLAPEGTGPELLVASRHEGPAGASDEEPDPRTGEVPDHRRADALERDLGAWRLALAAGVPLKGWFVGMLDEREAAEGRGVRAGIVHVAWPGGRRTPKASAARLRGLIERWA